jgi:hypothetical protein
LLQTSTRQSKQLYSHLDQTWSASSVGDDVLIGSSAVMTLCLNAERIIFRQLYDAGREEFQDSFPPAGQK